MRVADLAGRPDLLEPALALGDVGGQFVYQGGARELRISRALLQAHLR